MGSALLALGLGASARADDATVVPEKTHFLVIVDESASMGEFGPRTDRERLAVLAARAFLDLLDEGRDKVAVVGMNQLAAERGAPGVLAPLAPQSARALAAAQLAPGSGTGLSAYRGTRTPCRSALGAAREVLESWHKLDAEARQVVLFLTDGKCEDARGQGSEDPELAEAWLRGVPSRGMRFFLLSFEGNDLSPALTRYAEQSHGRHIVIPKGKDRPRGLVQAFADVFAGAQGYATEVVGRGLAERSFGRAEWVRVLALSRAGAAPGSLIRVNPVDKSRQPEVTPGQVVHFRHRAEQAYVYQVMTIRPREGARFAVESSAESAVLVPDYRGLRVELVVQPGRCSDRRDEAWDASRDVDATEETDACLHVALVSRRGALRLDDDLDYEAEVLRRPEAGGVFAPLPSMVRKVEQYSAHLRLHPSGAVRLVARVQVKAMPPPPPLRSREHALRCLPAALNVRPIVDGVETARVHLGRLQAGDSRSFKVRVSGHFRTGMPVRLSPTGALFEEKYRLSMAVALRDDPVIHATPAGSEWEIEIRSRRGRHGGKLAGKIVFTPADAKLQAHALRVELELVPTSWWAYWGLLVLEGLAALLALTTIICVARGWLVPARQLPAARRHLAFYFAREQELLVKPKSEFKVPSATRGAYELLPHIQGTGGWYRNAAILLGTPHCKLPSPGIELSLELQVGPGSFRVVRAQPDLELHRVDVNRRGEEACQREELGRVSAPTLGSRVGFPCRLYARLGGRMPSVHSMPFEMGTWYRVGGKGARYFFKIDDSPF